MWRLGPSSLAAGQLPYPRTALSKTQTFPPDLLCSETQAGEKQRLIRDKLALQVPSSDPRCRAPAGHRAAHGPSQEYLVPKRLEATLSPNAITKGFSLGGLPKGDLEEVIHKSLGLRETKITWGSEAVLLDEQKPTAGRQVLAFLGFPAPLREPRLSLRAVGALANGTPPWRLGPCRKGCLPRVRPLIWVTPSLRGPTNSSTT